MVLRHSILVHSISDYEESDKASALSGEIELDESYFGGRRKGNQGRGAAGKIPVFGILSRKDGKLSVSIVPDVKAETLLSRAVEKVRRSSIVYTDKFKAYDALVLCCYQHLSVDHSSRFSDGKIHTNNIEG